MSRNDPFSQETPETGVQDDAPDEFPLRAPTLQEVPWFKRPDRRGNKGSKEGILRQNQAYRLKYQARVQRQTKERVKRHRARQKAAKLEEAGQPQI